VRWLLLDAAPLLLLLLVLVLLLPVWVFMLVLSPGVPCGNNCASIGTTANMQKHCIVC
jgi:hypothetical protein